MRLYAHGGYILRGYGALTHEAIIFNAHEVKDVPDDIGDRLLGIYPLTFCKVKDDAMAKGHHCPLGAAPESVVLPPFDHREMEEPPLHREMRPKRKQREPAGRR